MGRLWKGADDRLLPGAELVLLTPFLASVALSWADNASNETGYVVERKDTGVYAQVGGTLPAGSTSYTDRQVAPSTTYSYRVRGFAV